MQKVSQNGDAWGTNLVAYKIHPNEVYGADGLRVASGGVSPDVQGPKYPYPGNEIRNDGTYHCYKKDA